MIKYPFVRRDENQIDVYHGVPIQDPYRWLEDPNSDETREFITRQNQLTMPYVTSSPCREQISLIVQKMWNYSKISAPFKRGEKYYQLRNSGLENQSVLYVLNGPDDQGEVFLNPNLFSEDGTVAMIDFEFSQDARFLAYGLSNSGSDWISVKFRDVETGKDLHDVLENIKISFVSWSGEGCFYGAYVCPPGGANGTETAKNSNQMLFYHKLGTSQSEDLIVADLQDPNFMYFSCVSHCGNYVILTPKQTTKYHLLYLAEINRNEEITNYLNLTAVITDFIADFIYVTNVGSQFIIRTNKNAPNYHLVVVDYNAPSVTNWKVLIPQREKDVLIWARPIDTDKLVLCYIRNVSNVLIFYHLTSKQTILEFSEKIGAIEPIRAQKEDSIMFFKLTSLVKPAVIYVIDFNQRPFLIKPFSETKIEGIDLTNLRCKQVFYESGDGTKIPMFIVHRKGLEFNKTNPCLLHGYGGFNVSRAPSFSVFPLCFIYVFNGVYAQANIRGGGEYGSEWHDAGRLENKQNCFDDFQYAGHYLIGKKYTNASKLTIWGASNGGLLVAACANQNPLLFGCVLCMVGILDMLRFHKFTIGYLWREEYGSPEKEDEFQYLLQYSPLHNVEVPRGIPDYPAVLLLTGDHDDRVVPAHSYKYIAELQHTIGELPWQGPPLLIRIETKAGHGLGKPLSKKIDEQIDMLCFVQKTTGAYCVDQKEEVYYDADNT